MLNISRIVSEFPTHRIKFETLCMKAHFFLISPLLYSSETIRLINIISFPISYAAVNSFKKLKKHF